MTRALPCALPTPHRPPRRSSKVRTPDWSSSRADSWPTRSTPAARSAQSYLSNYSAEPAIDRALLLNSGFVEGYRASRLSADKKQRYVIQLFKASTPAKAKVLADGFWRQEPRGKPFGVPSAFSSAQATYDATTEKTEAVAEATFVVGTLVAQLSVRQSAPLGTAIRPNTALITDLAARQRARLTSTSS